MIIREAIGVAETIDAAKEKALEELNARIEDDVQIEVLEMPKRKVLGLFGGSLAKVRVYIEGPDLPKKKNKKAEPKKNEKKAEPKKNEKNEKKAPKPNDKKEEKVEAKAEEELNYVDALTLDEKLPAARAYRYIVAVLSELGCENVTAKIAEIEGGSKILLEGEKLGVIIGRHGETLDAIQYLASLIANERGGGYYRIVLDIGNYRAKREQTLISLAKKTASQVLRTGRNRSLEPMNPYERRIIHTAIQEIDGVSSMSIGDGSNRRVVISVEGKSPRRNGQSRKSSARRSPEKTQTAAQSEIVNKVDVADVPLYGKISK